MKPTSARRASLFIIYLSAALFVSTLVLPHLDAPQSVNATVLPVDGFIGSQIYGYGVPPVQAGSEFKVTLSSYVAGHIEYSLSPTVGNTILPALAYGKVTNRSSYTFSVTAEDSYSLELFVTTYNGSGYVISYSGTWSPFDFLSVYTAPSIFLIMASVAAYYYYGTKIPKQRSEEEVERELARLREVPVV